MDPLLNTILGALEKGGPWAMAIVFAVMWWDQRSERKEMTTLLLATNREMIEAIKDAKAAIDMMRIAMGGKGGS